MTIPNGEHLYRYVNPKAFPKGQEEIPTTIFQDSELSCDWEKYQNDPYNSYHVKQGKSIIVKIEVHNDIKNVENPKRLGTIVREWCQEIIHAPISDEDDPVNGANFSHSLIKGLKKSAVTKAIAKHSVKLNNN